MARPALRRPGIEAAAIRLFAAKGLPGATIRDIASAAGVTEGALYRHYLGKEDMAWKLYCRETRRFLDAFEPILADEADPLPQRLFAAVQFIYRYYREDPDRLIFVLVMARSFPARSLDEEGLDPDAPILRILRQEMARGGVGPADPELLLAMLRGIVLEPIMMHRRGAMKAWPDRHAGRVAAAAAALLAAGALPLDEGRTE